MFTSGMSSCCEQLQEGEGLGEVEGRRVVLADAETGAVWQCDRRRFAGAFLARRLEGHGVEGAQPHADQQARSAAAQAGDYLAQEPGAVLEVPRRTARRGRGNPATRARSSRGSA